MTSYLPSIVKIDLTVTFDLVFDFLGLKLGIFELQRTLAAKLLNFCYKDYKQKVVPRYKESIAGLRTMLSTIVTEL
jgi:hypothetical protein